MLATCVIQPIDMIKVRIQLGEGSASSVKKTMLKNEGIGAFYKGLSAGLLRQATYTTARLGTFRWSASAKGGELESLGYKEGYRVDIDIPEGTWADAPSFHDILI